MYMNFGKQNQNRAEWIFRGQFLNDESTFYTFRMSLNADNESSVWQKASFNNELVIDMRKIVYKLKILIEETI